jgi:hypothetical protein
MVNPLSKAPLRNGNGAVNVVFPPAVVAFEIGTLYGRFCPEIYTSVAFPAPTTPSAENVTILSFAFGLHWTFRAGKAFRPMTSIFGHEPGTMNYEIALYAN